MAQRVEKARGGKGSAAKLSPSPAGVYERRNPQQAGRHMNRIVARSGSQSAGDVRREPSGPTSIGDLLEIAHRRIEERAARRCKRRIRRRRAA